MKEGRQKGTVEVNEASVLHLSDLHIIPGENKHFRFTC